MKVENMEEELDIKVCKNLMMEMNVRIVCEVKKGRYVEYIKKIDEMKEKGMEISEGNEVDKQKKGIGIEWDWEEVSQR